MPGKLACPLCEARPMERDKEGDLTCFHCGLRAPLRGVAVITATRAELVGLRVDLARAREALQPGAPKKLVELRQSVAQLAADLRGLAQAAETRGAVADGAFDLAERDRQRALALGMRKAAALVDLLNGVAAPEAE